MPRARVQTPREDGVPGQAGGTGSGIAVEARTDGHAATYAPKDPYERAQVAEMQSDALYEQLLKANAAPEPGMQAGQGINRNAAREIGLNDPSGQLSVPMVASQVESAGYTLVYDQASGETSVVNNNMLKQALNKLHPETGRVMFGLRPPAGVTPFRGKLKCRLHADDPERGLWDEMGFTRCGTANLRTPHVVTRHMETRHKQEWRAIKEREAEQEKQEQRAERKALMQLVSKGAAAPPAA